ncbi:MAG: Heavy metal translocating P-type ATPase [Parcubacteria group bacterium GW2011_GWB1_40_14]|nr:MAG: Heavy metal translocating P-type ATPase [Parcubacteria group bacterium GW2011_GWB1_40_14]
MPNEHIYYKVQGMHCASCSILINKTLGRVPGVISASANYGTERLALEYDPSKVQLNKIEELLKKIGYILILPKEGANEEEEAEKQRKMNLRSLRNRTIISFILASPIIGYYMATHMFNLTHIHALCTGFIGS